MTYTYLEAKNYIVEQSPYDIVDIISQHISLKKEGKNYVCRCPFHDEKTPSFKVSKDLKHFKCFGCPAKGDAIQFVRDYLGLEFREAIYLLADYYNIRISNKSRESFNRSLKKDEDILPGITSVRYEIYKSKHVYVAFKKGDAPFNPILFIDGSLSLEAAKLLKKRAQKIIFVAQDIPWKTLKLSLEAALKAELEVFAIPDYSNEFQEMDWVDYCSFQTTHRITRHDITQLIAQIPDNITRSCYVTYATDNFKGFTQ